MLTYEGIYRRAMVRFAFARTPAQMQGEPTMVLFVGDRGVYSLPTGIWGDLEIPANYKNNRLWRLVPMRVRN